MLIKVLNNEPELLLLIQKGDEAAFTILFHHYRNWLYSIALKLSGSSVLAEEVVQDVFLKIWLKRADLDHVKNFKAYLYVVVQNTMYKVLKKSTGVLTEPLQIVHEHTTNTFDAILDSDYKSLLQQGGRTVARSAKASVPVNKGKKGSTGRKWQACWALIPKL